jgi:tRNA threonylcarbamoyladenosine biosynthesis protein TsaE
MKKIITHNEKETVALGLALGKKCRGGEVFALCGDLGAGKTKLSQGLAKGLGVVGRVNSPTFNILKVYRVNGRDKGLKKNKVKFFCHIDAYRLKSEKDLIALGVKEFLDSSDTVTAIEWAEKVKKILPKRAVVIKIKDSGRNIREFTVQ